MDERGGERGVGRIYASSSPPPSTMPNVVLVTGGTGLVGKAIKHIIDTEPGGSRFAKLPGEQWIFASSSEGDLRQVEHPMRLALSLRCLQGSCPDACFVRQVQAHPCHPSRCPRCVVIAYSYLAGVSSRLAPVGGLFKNMKYKVRLDLPLHSIRSIHLFFCSSPSCATIS